METGSIFIKNKVNIEELIIFLWSILVFPPIPNILSAAKNKTGQTNNTARILRFMVFDFIRHTS